MDIRAIIVLLFVFASCDVIGAQRDRGRDEGSDDYFFESDRRRTGEEQGEESGAVATPQDPDGDGVIGEAGKDYPVLRRPPEDTSFTCHDKLPGIYADMDTGCQVYHVCQSDQRRESSLCVNGTVFNQETLACDWWYNVDCSASHRFYWVNAELGKLPAPRRGSEDFLGPPPKLPPPQHPPTSFTIEIPPPLKKAPPPLLKKLPPPPPFLNKKQLKDKPRPPHDVIHYGRDAFDPSLNVPPRPKSVDKKLGKQSAKPSGKSPLTVPVNSDDVIAGYSDLYLNKPVDED